MTEVRAERLGSATAPVTWADEHGGLHAGAAGAGGIGMPLRDWSRPVERGPSSGAVIFWFVLAIVVVAAAAIVAGGSGYPVFSLGLGFGFAVGAVPYGLFVLIHASASEIVSVRTGHRRRMTDEEWQRIFGPRSSGPGAWSAGESYAGAGWSRTQVAPPLDETIAYERLEIEAGATMKQITRAYHRLAHRYHPDLTVGLPEGERAIAEQRMKELNVAYELLRSRVRQEAS